MEKLARLREERKKLEVIETQVLSSNVDDAQTLHAWAAKELKQLSDSIRNELDSTELKTARKFVATNENVPPCNSAPQVDTDVLPCNSAPLVKTNVPPCSSAPEVNTNVPPAVITEASLSEIPPIQSESRLDDIPLSRPQNFELSLSSLTSSVSVSVDDEFSKDSVRDSSPEPLTERRFLNIADLATSKKRNDPEKVLDQFIERTAKEERAKRQELGTYAKELFNQAEIPSLASIEKRTKSGIAMNFDIKSFNSRRK